LKIMRIKFLSVYGNWFIRIVKPLELSLRGANPMVT
jgi:hypothetical protein